MAFEKKNSRKDNSNGRPEKEPEDTLSGMSEEERRKYFRQAKRKIRGADVQSPSTHNENRYPEITSNVGRPSLGEHPMTQNTRSERRRSQMRD